MGLGITFLLVALGLGWVTKVLGLVRRHIRIVNIAGASMLILLGLIMFSGPLDPVDLRASKPLRHLHHPGLTPTFFKGNNYDTSPESPHRLDPAGH